MTCKWPECDGNHARCAVLLACLDQVEEDWLPWTHNRDYRFPDWPPGPSSTPVAESRAFVARQVADRLLAWLRWPGTAGSKACDTAPGRRPAMCHPLDGTDVAGLRPCLISHVFVGEWPDGPMPRPEPVVTTDWPAVAVVADYLSSCGGWRWVHDFREPVYGKGVADTLRPYQAAADHADHELTAVSVSKLQRGQKPAGVTM